MGQNVDFPLKHNPFISKGQFELCVKKELQLALSRMLKAKMSHLRKLLGAMPTAAASDGTRVTPCAPPALFV